MVLVHGPAGMGKRALLRHFLRDDEGLRVLLASGDESETALAYGVVGQLVAGLPPPFPDPLTSLGTPGEPTDLVRPAQGWAQNCP